MAKRRCISVDFYDSEEFSKLLAQSKVLYTELILHSDDEGVVINLKAAMKICKAKAKNLAELMEGRFLIRIDGVYIIRHWYVHNRVQPSRKIASIYGEQLSRLKVNDNNEYVLAADNLLTDCRPNITKLNITEPKETKVEKNQVVGLESMPTQDELCNMDEYMEYIDRVYRENNSGNYGAYGEGRHIGRHSRYSNSK